MREGEIDTPTLRAALVAIRVMDDIRPWQPTTAQVAAYARMSPNGAYRLMARLSRVLPIAQDEKTGQWQRAE